MRASSFLERLDNCQYMPSMLFLNKEGGSMTQLEFLEFIRSYNSLDRKVIKDNLLRIMDKYKIEPKDIIALGYQKWNIYSWRNKGANNIPMFEQALDIAVAFEFDVREFIEENV